MNRDQNDNSFGFVKFGGYDQDAFDGGVDSMRLFATPDTE